MQDYRPQVERALLSIECKQIKHMGAGMWRWYSPRTKTKFMVDYTIPTRGLANEILRNAGHGPIFPPSG